jgi:agmatine deiminase
MTEESGLRGPAPTPRQMGFRMPAEWEPQESVWLVWPRDPLTWPDRVHKARGTFLAAMRAITPRQRVDLVVHHDLAAEAQAAVAGAGITNVAFHAVDHQDSWIRDYGPIYLVRRALDGRERMAVKWDFNAWGNKYESLLKDKGVVAQLGAAVGAPLQEVRMVLEGGSIDVDGQGTLLTTEQCLLNKNRNPVLARTDIERHLKEYVGVEKVLWLGDGIEGDDTDGHIDDLARFIDERTIAIGIETNQHDPNYAILRKARRALDKARDQDGNPFNILELPMPRPLSYEGQRVPATYVNFYFAGSKKQSALLVPTFGQRDRDRQAIRILHKHLPKRDVIGVDCRKLIWGLGAIHCFTQQQPRF